MGKPYTPPYTITSEILNLISEISELLGYWSAQGKTRSPQLRKENRIRTIQASLAIEHNSLTVEQVSAIMEGKRVFGPAKDIQEVRNAIKAYEQLSQWQSAKLSHLLNAHDVLMSGLIDDAGRFRQRGVAIYQGQQVIHMAPPASEVRRLMTDLFGWLDKTDIHPLIASSAFHYEFEFIHPFSDGNGRMGRLWQTAILSRWRKELAWLPIETLIKAQQDSYYHVLGEADKVSDCTCFIEFMLSVIKDALKESIHINHLSEEMSEYMSEENAYPSLKKLARQMLVKLKINPYLTIAELAEQLAVSTRTIERQLHNLQKEHYLERMGSTKSGHWHVKR